MRASTGEKTSKKAVKVTSAKATTAKATTVKASTPAASAKAIKAAVTATARANKAAAAAKASKVPAIAKAAKARPKAVKVTPLDVHGLLERSLGAIAEVSSATWRAGEDEEVIAAMDVCRAAGRVDLARALA